MRLLIQNGTVVNGSVVRKADVLVEGATIRQVAPQIQDPGGSILLDAAGCLLFPGFIDTHTHFDLTLGNGVVTADDFPSGTAAAVLGGTTTILDFATQERDTSLMDAFDTWQKKAEGSSCDYGFHMAIARWDAGVSKEIDLMAERGITSYKMYMVYDALKVDDGEIYRASQRIRDAGGLLGMHCENWELLLSMVEEQKAMGNGARLRAHAWSRPAEVEAEAVGRYLRIAQLAKAPAYIVHLSTAEGLSEALRARERGQRVYLETCPQYLVLDESMYDAPDGAKFVMSPPLRNKVDQEALWRGLQEGEIETIGTDHCSFTMKQKALGEGDFGKIPNGGAGVQARAQILYTYGVQAGRISLPQMAAVLSENAAKLFGMAGKKGVIAPGADADIVIWDPDYRETLSWKTLSHNCDNTPFEGIAVEGRARDVLMRGECIVKQGALVKTGAGRYVHRAASGSL